MNKHFCPYCMTPVKEGETCPSCGLTAGNYVPSPHHLPPGTVLLDRYLVGRVLGEGGFGITYIGCDLRLELKVAIKEYYPVDRATRNAAVSTNVTSFIGPSSRSFERGKQKFLSEARTMARMDKQQVIVSVRDFFETNNTVYIVMEYIEGTTFAALTEQRGGRIPPDELFRVIEPLFGALSALHETGLIHRDISPDNLMLEGGEVRLLDFGCAREPAEGNKTLTISLKHGYAPLEQYQESGQGPWTDIYALCATIYHCLTGQTPPRALDRIGEDQLILPSKLGVAITPQQEQALLKGLRIQPTRRFQSMKELWAALYAPQELPIAEPVPAQNPAEIPPEPVNTEAAPALTPIQKPRWKKLLPIGLGAAAILALILIFTLPKSRDDTPQPSQAETQMPVMADVVQSEGSTVSMTEWDEDRFWALMADESVAAVKLEVPGMDPAVNFAIGQKAITKPLLIGEDTYLHPLEAEIGPGGYVEAPDFEHFSARMLRLSGFGEQIRYTGSENRGWTDDNTLIWANEEANYGSILDGIDELPRLIIGSEDTLFAGATVVTNLTELAEANASDTPVILGADITQTASDPDPRIHVPVLIPEGCTLTAVTTDISYLPFSLCDSFVINHGSMQGHFYMEGRGAIINYGLFGSDAADPTPASRVWMKDQATLLNFGTCYTDDWTDFVDGAGLFNKGELIACRTYFENNAFLFNLGELRVRGSGYYIPGLHLSGGALLENIGSLTVETTGEDVLFPGPDGVRESGRSCGTLVNFARIVNHGQLRVEDDTEFYNLRLENGGSVSIAPNAHLDTQGSVMWGSGNFDLGDSEQMVYRYLRTDQWSGKPRDATTAQELLEAVDDPAADCVFLRGDVTLDEPLSVTKPMRIDGSLTLTGDATLTLDAAILELGAGGSFISAGNVQMINGAVFSSEGYGSSLQIRDGGTLIMNDALYCGEGSPALGSGAAVTLKGCAAMAMSGTGTTLDSGTLTIENAAVCNVTGAGYSFGMNHMVIVLRDSASLVLGGSETQLDGCQVALEGGSYMRLESQQSSLHSCDVAIEKDSSLYFGNSPVRLSAGTSIENRGSLDIHLSGADKLQIDRGATIINFGELFLETGQDDPQAFIRSGAIVNHGKLHSGE